MQVRDLGDKVEIIETVAEINARYEAKGLQPPIVVLNNVDCEIHGVQTWLSHYDAKRLGYDIDKKRPA